jgi:hypothetical protein
MGDASMQVSSCCWGARVLQLVEGVGLRGAAGLGAGLGLEPSPDGVMPYLLSIASLESPVEALMVRGWRAGPCRQHA